MNTLPQHVCVCIIGGGVAGLGAAQQLIQSGVDDILILEAQDRVGGRIFTLKHGKDYIEMGAHWIHGEEGNVIYEWASKNGLVEEKASVTQTGYGETIFVRQDGKVVSEEVVLELVVTAANLEESAEKELETYPYSVGHYFMEKFKSVNRWGTVGNEFLEWQQRFQNCIQGSGSMYDVSRLNYLTYEECPGDPTINWKQDGYQTLINHLQEAIPPSCLALNSPVKCIDWDVTTTGTTSGCKVTLESGVVVNADHVIFTASLGVLKAQAKNMFSPSLPQQMMKAIEGLGFDVVGKIYLQFPHRWWDDKCDGFSILPDLRELPAAITQENWECGLLGFYAVHKQPNMMCAWMTGPTARAVEETPECEVTERCMNLLRKLLSPKWTIPQATWCKRSAWGSNPYVRGSYSFYSMKSEELGVQTTDLAQPLCDSSNNPIVCFAGEATHPCYYSTVHGALESGRREATRITRHISRLRMKQPEREKYKVVIVGGGAAGIGAARELTHHGINSVLILEGSDRVGGRIETVPTPPHGIVEFGAQWIHGEVDNVIYKIAAARNLLHHHLSHDGEGSFITENGQVINEDIVRQVSKVMQEANEECSSFCNNIEKNYNIAQLSVGEVFRKKFMEHLQECQSDSAEVRELKTALFYWHLRFQRIDNACDSLHQLSAKCWGLYELCKGKDNLNPNAGYLSILETLLAETAIEVKLYSEVSCIDYALQVQKVKDGYVRQDGTAFPVSLKCRDGREYEAQHVIVTSSIGYLKSHPHLFTPPLPTKLQQTVTSRGYGTLDKIFLEYEEAWWSDGCEGIQLVWTRDIPDFERHIPHTKCVDGTNEEISKYWVRAISGFDPVFSHPARLCGWIGGAEAEYMESLSVHQVGTDCTHLLRKFLPNTDIPYPKKVYRSQWATNPLICGGYSYHTVGCLCCSGAEDTDLNSPVSASSDDGTQVPVVVLAGEANSKKYYSTVHGALQNGMQQATHYIESHKRLIGSIKSKM